jgi:CRP-like cAMP-binding protein
MLQNLKAYLDGLSPVSDEAWLNIMPLFTESTLKKGNSFITEGQTARSIGFLQTGIVRAFYRSHTGVEYNKHFFTPPCFIGGYASLITGKPNTIIQQALTDCTVYTADYRAFTALYNRFNCLERAARRLAEIYFIEKEQREIELVLLDAAERYAIFNNQHPGLAQQIPQYHIASYLGVTPTQLSRIRKKISHR